MKRAYRILYKLTPIILSFIRDFRRYVFWGNGKERSDEEHVRRAKKLTAELGSLGATFIKLAQVLSARADVLPPVYLKELSTLQDRAEPEPTDIIKSVIQQELNAPVATIFDEFEEEPIAAASLGQVHRARYHGEEIVLKVLRPEVIHKINTDLTILHGILNLLNLFISYSPFLRSLTIVLNEFHRVILEEVDFSKEARNVKIFRKNLAHETFVLIPNVYEEFTTPRLLVLEYLEGVKINNVDEIERMGVDINVIIQRLTRVYIHQVMVDGFLHADPHPGNILVNRQGQIIILDFGMVMRIDETFKKHIIKYAVALAHRDIDGMVNALYELQLVEPGTNKAILRDLSEVMLEIQEQGKITARRVQQMGNAMMEAFYEFPFTLPSELVYVIRATALIEGIGFIHDPWFDAVAVGRPIIKEMAQDILREELQGNVLETLEKWAIRAYQTATALQDTIIKFDREQIRFRIHPTDIQGISLIMTGAVRRVLAGMFCAMTGMICGMIYLRTGSLFSLLIGFLLPGAGIGILWLLPGKKPQLHQAHRLQKHLKLMTTAEGEVYKSRVISQMTAEERAKAEEARQRKQAADAEQGTHETSFM